MEVKLIKPIPKPEKPPVPLFKRVQCQANVMEMFHNPQWRQTYYGPKKEVNGKKIGGRGFGEGDHTHCQRNAVVEIDGKNLCRMHAGFIALDHLLKQK